VTAADPAAPSASLPTIILCGLAAFLWGLAVLHLVRGDRLGTGLPRGARLALRRAARRRDARAFAHCLARTARDHPPAAAAWRADPSIRADLAALDAHLFGAGATAAPPLPALRRRILRAACKEGTPPASDALMPIDGPAAHLQPAPSRRAAVRATGFTFPIRAGNIAADWLRTWKEQP
jgi:hypothetical protein